MFHIKIKDKMTLDQALKLLKHKVQKTKMISELRERESYTKPSVKRRQSKLNSIYNYQQKFKDSQ